MEWKHVTIILNKNVFCVAGKSININKAVNDDPRSDFFKIYWNLYRSLFEIIIALIPLSCSFSFFYRIDSLKQNQFLRFEMQKNMWV